MPVDGQGSYSDRMSDAAAAPTEGERRALSGLETSGIPFQVTRHGRVGSLAEAAEARGIDPAGIVKTIVVRRGDDDFLFVLVPGDRTISWPKLRALLGVSRLSMPDAATAKDVTGYERGTITPFGSLVAWPVVADSRVRHADGVHRRRGARCRGDRRRCRPGAGARRDGLGRDRARGRSRSPCAPEPATS